MFFYLKCQFILFFIFLICQFIHIYSYSFFVFVITLIYIFYRYFYDKFPFYFWWFFFQIFMYYYMILFTIIVVNLTIVFDSMFFQCFLTVFITILKIPNIILFNFQKMFFNSKFSVGKIQYTNEKSIVKFTLILMIKKINVIVKQRKKLIRKLFIIIEMKIWYSFSF